ncbi:MAG: POTRA domain-containing protein, partial [Pseudomonadota bacterium]|nr:POTRA domain-containing protein [Pseudomonadota bacterium]
MISARHSHLYGRRVSGWCTGLVLIAAALSMLWDGIARAQTMVTPKEAAQLVQAQPVAGDQTDASELEAAAASAAQFDPLSPKVYGPGTIEQIIVRGNQRLSSSTILSILPVRVGQDFEPIRLANALKSLYATGQFADVRIDRSGNVLIIQVRENVLINMVNFEGNGALSDDELTGLIKTTGRSVLSRTQVAEDIRAMKERYEILGRLLVVIEPKIIPLTGNQANLVFEINEGARTRIDAVNFVGNQAYNDRRLRSVILSKQSNIFRNLLQADGYSPGRVQVDKNFLTEFYQSRGFADFQVVSAIAEQTPEKRRFILSFTIREGIRYRVGQIRIANNMPGVDTSQLVNRLKVRTGQTFDITEIEATKKNLIERVSAQGFPFVEVEVSQSNDPTRGIV